MNWNSVQAKAISYLIQGDIAALKNLSQAAGKSGNTLVDATWTIKYAGDTNSLTAEFSIIPKSPTSLVSCWLVGFGIDDSPIASAASDEGANVDVAGQHNSVGFLHVTYALKGKADIQFHLSGTVRDKSGNEEHFEFEAIEPIDP